MTLEGRTRSLMFCFVFLLVSIFARARTWLCVPMLVRERKGGQGARRSIGRDSHKLPGLGEAPTMEREDEDGQPLMKEPSPHVPYNKVRKGRRNIAVLYTRRSPHPHPFFLQNTNK